MIIEKSRALTTSGTGELVLYKIRQVGIAKADAPALSKIPAGKISSEQEICDFAVFATLRRTHLETKNCNYWMMGLGAMSLGQTIWSVTRIVDSFDHFSGLKAYLFSSPAFISLAFALCQTALLPKIGYKIAGEIADSYQAVKATMLSRYSSGNLPELLRNIDFGAWQTIRSGLKGVKEESDLPRYFGDDRLTPEKQIGDFGELLALKHLSQQFYAPIMHLGKLTVASIFLGALSIIFVGDFPELLHTVDDKKFIFKTMGFLVASYSFYFSSIYFIANNVYNRLIYNTTGRHQAWNDYLASRYAEQKPPEVLGEINNKQYEEFAEIFEAFNDNSRNP